jgi:carboxypeptidase Q
VTRTFAATVALAIAAGALAGCPPPPRRGTSTLAWVDDVSLTVRTPTPSPPHLVTFADDYRATAASILASARGDHAAYEKLRHLTDEIGHRLSGSKELDRAIEWAAATMKAEGHDVRTEEVLVPHWVRGAESAAMTAPYAKKLTLLGLGGSVPTKKGGVKARVVVVHSWADLEAKKADVAGAIVLYDVAMPKWTKVKGSGYGDVVPYRTRGAIAAAKLGAVGVLVRSVTAHSVSTAHTGAMTYDDKVTKIPAAAITVEDAALISRLVEAGEKVEVKLELASKQLPDAKSANVLGELRGRELPDEVVVIAAHIDSWDVGQGAHDDGAGVVMMMQALTTLRKLGVTPRRTVRVVLFTNEENGTRGAKAYFAAHQDELALHAAALEADSGGFAPVGFDVDAAADETRGRMAERVGTLVQAIRGLGDLEVRSGHSGADIDPLVKAGVPGFGLVTDGQHYFDYHHTDADTLDKVDPDDLAACVGAVAAMAYMLAELPGRIDAPAEDPLFEPRVANTPTAPSTPAAK